MDAMKKVPVREQDPLKRAKNFDEVCLGYNEEEAVEEAIKDKLDIDNEDIVLNNLSICNYL